ncbi:putative disease resistance protein RGA3 [Solanum verrucosum]|uniref:putative disease resistance protein RGA3 n=1 Tax=Solanum verrucosum TaxID=315347 RepID=UPI0020D044D8|nr:putative disease resistance protein RGA3 [Solanum verrucosum]
MDNLRGINTSRGNCILVTTRIKQVTSTVAVDLHMLGRLARDHCWSIFKQRTFVDGEVPEEVVSMENGIVEMCQGLPLAASVLGGLLRNKEKHEWHAILDDNPLVAGEYDNGENSLKKILKLSYDYLPSPYLKKCFAYFAIFPKDFEFEKDQLIQFWMAEGFLRPCQEAPVMEDVGNKFFQLLLQNSLLQDVKLDEQENTTHCKMHDLVHDLARDILKSKLSDPKSVGRENFSQVRYFGWDSPKDQIDRINEPERLCRLFWRSNYVSEDILLNFKFLRVLNLSSSGIKVLSAKIGKLIYLRYLDLSDTKIKVLPKPICKLYNLQTFRINSCFSLKKLLEEMTNMISLRHIHFNYHYQSNLYFAVWGSRFIDQFQMPLNMGQLTSLQTLPFFYLGLEKGRQIEELGRLKNLRGELTIKPLQLVVKKEEARTTYLQEKSNIYKLAYLWSHDESEDCEINDEHVLDGLQPHPNLKTLTIVDYLGTKFPSWFSEGLLPNLVVLKLSGCKRCKDIPSLGQLKFLRHLQLIGFLELESIGPTFYGVDVNDSGSSSNNLNIQMFPSLKELVLKNMRNLIEWKGDELGVRMFSGLEKLKFTKCPLLKITPSQFEILCELSIEGVNSEMPLLNLFNNLTSLVKLIVDDVKELTCLSDEMLHNNVSLQHLLVSLCRKFHELPQNLYNLHSLKSLRISFCPYFSSFPVPTRDNYLTSLQSLELCHCDRLTSLPNRMLNHCLSLVSLNVINCNNLVPFFLPARGLHRLGILQIDPFSEMVDFEAFQLIFNGIQQLLSLRTLEVRGHLHWDSLPYQLMQLSDLTAIQIHGFGIEALPHRLHNLTSLERLTLERCKRPQHLDFSDTRPKLRYVVIRNCPLLEAVSDGLGNLVSLQELSF